MAMLCLLLGLLSIMGSSYSTDQSTTVADAQTPAADVATVATITSAVIQSGTSATSADGTLANTDSNNIVTTIASTIAPEPATSTTILPDKAPTSLASQNTPAPVTNLPESPITTLKPETASKAVTATIPLSTSTVDRSSLPVTVPGQQPQETGATDTTQVSITTITDLVTSASDTSSVTGVTTHSLITDPPLKDIDTITTALSSSAPIMMSSTEADGHPASVTTKSVTPEVSSVFSMIPTTVAKIIEDHEQTDSEPNTEIPATNESKKNIKVTCSNEQNKKENIDLYVLVNTKGSGICENDELTKDDQAIVMQICQALKPGYQEKQDKCNITLGKINDGKFFITEAFVQSHLKPDDLFTQLKRNGANPAVFTFGDNTPMDEDLVSIPLISAIVSLAVLLLIIAAAYGCWHQRKARKREQRLTEELQTMENGYHDNPTLEVMETAPEMQEKKGGPNGELGDSWIVPLDNLTREDLEDEEDTHL